MSFHSMPEEAGNVSRMPDRGIVCLRRFYIRKGALVAICDLRVNAWHLVLKDCKWFSRDNREWIGMPSTSFKNRESKIVYKDLIEFDDKDAQQRFQAAALQAVKTYRD